MMILTKFVIKKFGVQKQVPKVLAFLGGSEGMLPREIFKIYYANLCILNLPEGKKFRFQKRAMHVIFGDNTSAAKKFQGTSYLTRSA
jgi:hypothetical protein